MVIVADGVEIGHLLEERGVAGIHVEETHRQPALVRVLGGRAEAVIVVADARRLRDPDKQILFVVVTDLLPHLEKTVHRIAGEIAIGHRARELERAVRQIGGKARVGDIAGLSRGIGGIGLRELAIRTRPLWI